MDVEFSELRLVSCETHCKIRGCLDLRRHTIVLRVRNGRVNDKEYDKEEGPSKEGKLKVVDLGRIGRCGQAVTGGGTFKEIGT